MPAHRIFGVPFADIHPLYLTKVERKGRTRAELDAVLGWLTGYDEAGLQAAIDDRRTLAEFFGQAPAVTPDAGLVTGVVCGVRVEDVDDPLVQRIRRMDKLVDELAKGKPVEKVVRTTKA